MRQMKIICTNCYAETESNPEGPKNNEAYKLLCPVLRDHTSGVQARHADHDCPYMLLARHAAMKRARSA